MFAIPTAMRAAILLAVCVLCALGCSRDRDQAPARREPLPPPPQPIADAGAWAKQVGREPASVRDRDGVPRAIVPRAAVMPDVAEATAEHVFASRLMYRVSFSVPPGFRDHRAIVAAPAGELHIDVSMNRLRARLVGPGWPVDEGTEIRVRSELPGVYLFDGQGGRSLSAGQLAAWFEGREKDGHVKARVMVRRDFGPPAERPMPSDLICALIAEWSGYPRSQLAYRCTSESLPPGFRVGPWTGELTAVVPMELPRRALRGDEADPPPPIAVRSARSLIEAASLAKLVPSREVEQSGPATLTVHNQTNARAIVIAQGVAVGWADRGKKVKIDGFPPGWYRVGAIKPLGGVLRPPRLVRIPGELEISTDGKPADD